MSKEGAPKGSRQKGGAPAPAGRGVRRRAILEAAEEVIARRGVRGMRVEQVAEQAGVAVSLIYYHFASRAGLLRATLAFANEQASSGRLGDGDADAGYAAVERVLLGELREAATVRRNSLVWGELLSTAAFEHDLRDPVHEATSEWNRRVAARIRAAQERGEIPGSVDAERAAERLTALIDGLATRWHAGGIGVRRARGLLKEAIRQELRADA